MLQAWLQQCASALSVAPGQVKATAALLREDATPPFIVRYRGDVTGGLDERQVLAVRRALHEHEALEERRNTILKALEKNDKCGKILLDSIRAAPNSHELEDLYAPFKSKASSLADAARARGLGALADRVWSGTDQPDELRTADTDIGVLHLLAERVSQNLDGRAALRRHFWLHASLALSEPKKDAVHTGRSSDGRAGGGKGGSGRGDTERSTGRGKGGGKVGGGKQSKADVHQLIGGSFRACQLPSHRTLAINRAEARKELRVAVTLPDKEVAINLLCATPLPALRAILFCYTSPSH